MNVTPPSFPAHCVDTLRQRCQEESTRHFNARGILLKRCPQCMLGVNTCICAWRRPSQCNIEFVLLMHRDEIYKPTNTGRLIADLFPEQCHAFIWDRVNPPTALLTLLQDPTRHCQILFPPTEDTSRRVLQSPFDHADDRLPTVIVLDGTWKQASRMARKSDWLSHLPTLDLSAVIANNTRQSGGYRVRQASDASRLSTTEAAALVLQSANSVQAADQLLDYFEIFNEHYVAARMNRQPAHLDAHQRLQSFMGESA